jgi:hypothetical protein
VAAQPENGEPVIQPIVYDMEKYQQVAAGEFKSSSSHEGKRCASAKRREKKKIGQVKLKRLIEAKYYEQLNKVNN